MFAALDWLPTFVEIAGGPKGDALKQRLEAGQYPGLVKTTLDGVNQIDYLTGKSEKSARDHFLYYSGKDPSAVRYQNWKMYFAMVSDAPAGFIPVCCPTTGPRSSTSKADRPAVVADAPRDLYQIPAAAESGQLQPGTGHAAGSGNEDVRPQRITERDRPRCRTRRSGRSERAGRLCGETMKTTKRSFAVICVLITVHLSLSVGHARDADRGSDTLARAETAKQQCINTCRARYRDCRRLNQLPSFECRGVYQDCTRYACTG